MRLMMIVLLVLQRRADEGGSAIRALNQRRGRRGGGEGGGDGGEKGEAEVRQGRNGRRGCGYPEHQGEERKEGRPTHSRQQRPGGKAQVQIRCCIRASGLCLCGLDDWLGNA